MIKRLITELGNPGLEKGEMTLQEVLTKVTCESRNEPPFAQMWSTMSLKLDFPKHKNIYIPHRFKEPHMAFSTFNYESFTSFVQTLVSCENQLVLVSAPPGMGKSRASEEIYSSLVISMNSYLVLHQKLNQTISYWSRHILANETPTVESFLQSCIDKRKEEFLRRHLGLGRVFVILDGFDEICPSYRAEVLKMIKDLLNKNLQVLLTSRPQEDTIILEDLKLFKVITVTLDSFEDNEKVLMLQTRLSVSADECKNMLATFDGVLQGFSSNPLHLQMICDIQEKNRKQVMNVYEIYQTFLKKKLKHGLLTCRQRNEESQYFVSEYQSVENILTKNAVCLIMNRVNVVADTTEEDVLAINLSGVATVVQQKGPIEFVHRSFPEFMVAKKMLSLCVSPSDERETSHYAELFCKSSPLTRKFFENGISQSSDKELVNESIRALLESKWDQVMTCICREGLYEVFQYLIEKPFGATQVAKWLQISQENAFQTNNDDDALFVLACQHNQLAIKFAEICSCSVKLRYVYGTTNFIAERNKSPIGLEILLSKVQRWQENMLQTVDVERFMSADSAISPFSTEQMDFLIKECPQLEHLILSRIPSLDFSKEECSVELLPVLLKNGLDLTVEKSGIKVANLFCRSRSGEGFIYLFEFSSEVVKHFKNTKDFDSERSVIYRKNIGAISPKEYGYANYTDHIVECVSRLFDTGACYEKFNILHGLMEALHTKIEVLLLKEFYLFLLRIFPSENDDTTGVLLSNFFSVVDQIPRNFKYNCGCSLAHTKYAKTNVAMMKLLAQNGFSLMEKNNLEQTPLHIPSIKYDGFEFLLRHMLKEHFVALEEEECPARTDEQQMRIETLLSARDNEGQMVIHKASRVLDGKNLTLIAKNLLGNLFLARYSKHSRSAEQQRVVERNLLVQDALGRTPMHFFPMIGSHLETWLRNLLGEFFITKEQFIQVKRSLEKQKQIAWKVLVMDQDGANRLKSYLVLKNASFLKISRLLQNVLGEYFVSLHGQTLKPLDQRSEEERRFVRSVLSSADKMLAAQKIRNNNVKKLLDNNFP